MSDYQKLPTEEQQQAEKELAKKRLDDDDDHRQPQQSYQGAYVRAGMVTAVSLIVLCALSVLCAGGFNHPALVHPAAFEKAALLEKLESDARQAAKGLVKRGADAQQEASRSASPTYSSLTTTDQRGEPTTQSFVYTTRPIVNPGGYTIGTMTGYVQIKPTATASAINSSSTEQATSTPASSEPTLHRLPGASVLAAASEAAASEAAAAVEAEGAPIGARLAKRDAAVVDAIATDATASPTSEPAMVPPVTTTGSGTAEYSTSTDRAGSVYTLVKTTRPIVNPGGYTIGTLNGAWVDVAKQTQAASSANRDKRNAATAIQHEELRRRNVVDLQA